jgi:CDGSH-type Zn-finger protein
VQLEGADPDDVADAVHRCPTGALQFEWLDRDDGATVEPAVVEVQRNGPYYLRGPVTVRSVNGEVVSRGPRVALCRCGGTKNAPFCDNTHRSIGFVDPPSGAAGDREAPSDPRP